MQLYTSETDGDRQGAVLGMVLVIVAMVSLLGAGMMTHSRSIAVEAAKAVSQSQAFWTAEAGLQRLLAIARDAPLEPLEDISLHGVGILEGSTAKGTYTVNVEDAPGWVNALHDVKRYRIVSTGISTGGRTSVVQADVELSTFGRYVMSSNISVTPDDQPIYFGHNDTIMGPVYANDTFNVWHDPIFLFPSPEGDDWTYSSAAGEVNYNAADESLFHDDDDRTRLRLNQPVLDFEPLSGFFDDRAVGAELQLVGDYAMTFHAGGTVTYEPVGGGTITTNDVSAAGGRSIYVDGSVEVEGVVDGDVELFVNHGIHIEDDLTYQSAGPANSPWGLGFNPGAVDDSLLLVSKEYVRLEEQLDETGKKVKSSDIEDLTVHASIYVTEDNTVGNPGMEWYGLCAEDWEPNIGKPSLNLYGGIVQYRRGVVARPPNMVAEGTSPNPFGYGKNFRYDSRMAAFPGPYSGYFVRRWSYQ